MVLVLCLCVDLRQLVNLVFEVLLEHLEVVLLLVNPGQLFDALLQFHHLVRPTVFNVYVCDG